MSVRQSVSLFYSQHVTLWRKCDFLGCYKRKTAEDILVKIPMIYAVILTLFCQSVCRGCFKRHKRYIFWGFMIFLKFLIHFFNCRYCDFFRFATYSRCWHPCFNVKSKDSIIIIIWNYISFLSTHKHLNVTRFYFYKKIT